MLNKYKIKSFIILLLCIFFTQHLPAQNNKITGTVSEDNGKGMSVQPLPGANVFWYPSLKGTTTDASGNFSIDIEGTLPNQLVISFVGYNTDTLTITKPGKYKILLKTNIELDAITVEGRQDATIISTIKPLNTELIGEKELLKAACCNLSESFETNPSVNVSYTDAITGAKEIQMLGLSGIYSQIMTENIPNIRGLASTYGLGYIPGTWMESIQITKGSGSVANGYESTTGQINVEYLKPAEADKTYINVYGASTGNVELNAHQAFKLNKKTSSIVMFHGENMSVKWDHQDDNFLDMPLVSNYNFLNRWSFNDGKKFEGQFGIKLLYDKRRSGETNYNWSDNSDTTKGYGVQIKTKRIELFSKTGLIFPSTPWKSAGLILSGSFHDQNSYFGLKTYDGEQASLYGSLIYMSIITNTNHKWKAGLDLRYDNYEEIYIGSDFYRDEIVPGAYAEYTLNLQDKFGLVAGSRVDHHNSWGWFYTPRLHLKYNFTPEMILRVSAGRSFRTANVFADNIGIMASSRNLVIEESLKPERAWNYGANLTKKFILSYRPGSISIDYYITDFSNQVIVDTYTASNQILMYNLTGESYSRSFQVAFNYEFFKRFDVRIAYKNDQVVMDFKNISSQKPLVPEHRGLLNVSYNSKQDNWRYDVTFQYQGMSKLAISDAALNDPVDDTQVKNNKSPEFVTINGQITHVFNKQWEIYLGVENLTDFRQKKTVINADDPFGEGFDATNIWGPVMGRKIYAGFRFKIK